MTAQDLVSLYLEMKTSYPDFELATGLCNQDSVEHAHSKLRGRGGFKANPTLREEKGYNKLNILTINIWN